MFTTPQPSSLNESLQVLFTPERNNTQDALIGWPGPSSGNTRTSYDILWNCLATIFSCTWTVLHFNIPRLGERRIKLWQRNAAWVCVNLIVPEFTVVIAAAQWKNAVQSVKAFRELGFTKKEWTLVHGYYAEMGGFVIVAPDKTFVANSEDLVTLINASVINKDTLTMVTKEDILDRSKKDGLGQAVTFAQALWFIVNLLGRKVAGLRITQMELSTSAYVLAALIIYICWWNKPPGINLPTVLEIRPIPKMTWNDLQQHSEFHSRYTKQRIAHSYDDAFPGVSGAYRLIGALIVLNAVEVAAWNFTFPTFAELISWRVLCLTAIGAPAAMIPIVKTKCVEVGFVLAVSLYVISRLGLIVLSFISLRTLPASTYESLDWANAFPHI